MSAIQQVMAALGAGAAAPGQQVFTSSGTFTVPAGVTSICAVAVGRGQNGAAGDGMGTAGRGGEGGTLSYTNSISVTPGESLTVTIATSTSGSTGETTLKRSSTVLLAARAGGQTSGQANVGTSFAGGTAPAPAGGYGSGGGGAGGYSGAGGAGGSIGGGGSAGSGGSGGGGGGGNSGDYSGGGGGVGLLGAGTNGTAGSGSGGGGGGGSGGAAGASGGSGSTGGAYGGGGGGGNVDYAGGSGGAGALRIIWGAGRSYPSTNTGDV